MSSASSPVVDSRRARALDDLERETRGENLMPENTIRVVARLVARPDTIDEVRSLLEGLLEPTRKEQGCLAYELLQNVDDPTDFTFVEEWTGKEVLTAHFLTPHFQEARERAPTLLAGPADIRSYHRVG